MFKRLLVPLDGSRLAESVLPAAVMLAHKLGASVTLVHIIEKDAPHEVHGERHLTTFAEAEPYLERIAREVFPEGVAVDWHVHTAEVEDITQGIVEHIEELHPDLIVMCTHGSGGLRDVLFGSIAQQVVASSTIPVLLIQPGEEEQPPQVFDCTRMLVPLDGATAHEHGLAAAIELARACSSRVYLLLVVPTADTLSGPPAATGRMLPSATRAVLEMACESGEDYLTAVAEQRSAQGLAVEVTLRRGDEAESIVRTAQELEAGVIVLGTHGKKGIDAFWAGSIAPRIVTLSALPLLLVPIPGE